MPVSSTSLGSCMHVVSRDVYVVMPSQAEGNVDVLSVLG